MEEMEETDGKEGEGKREKMEKIWFGDKVNKSLHKW
jgi:hypothetical protein